MNTEKIYENSTEREFLKELYSRRREDAIEEGIQAMGLITKDNSLYKINEEDGLEPHQYSLAGLCSYVAKNDYIIFDRGKLIAINQAIRIKYEQGYADVRITSSPTQTIFAVNSLDTLSYFQVKSIYVLALNALSIGFENIRLGVSSKDLNIEFNKDIIDVIDILEKHLDELKKMDSGSFGK